MENSRVVVLSLSCLALACARKANDDTANVAASASPAETSVASSEPDQTSQGLQLKGRVTANTGMQTCVLLLPVVRDAAGNSEVTFKPADLEAWGMQLTTRFGEFHFRALPPGTYQLGLGHPMNFVPLKTMQGLGVEITLKDGDPLLDLGFIVGDSEQATSSCPTF